VLTILYLISPLDQVVKFPRYSLDYPIILLWYFDCFPSLKSPPIMIRISIEQMTNFEPNLELVLITVKISEWILTERLFEDR
jgi:hypothetical protein